MTTADLRASPPSTLRAALVAEALSVVNIGAGAGADPERYADLIADGETRQARADMIRESGCGLVVRGLWRRVFDETPAARDLAAGAPSRSYDPRLRAPYAVGSVMNTIERMAIEARAWHPANEYANGLYVPQPGDVFMIGSPARATHVGTLVLVDDGPTCLWESVDGGQRDASGAEIIRRVTRVVVARGAAVSLNGRPLLGLVDLDALGVRFAS